jgi:hypothetical protein
MQGSMRNGVLYRRPTAELRTDASGCSSWPTPDANTATYSNGYGGFVNIREAATRWATPAASDDVRGTTPYSQAEVNRPQGKPMTLAKDVAEWQTPSGQMHNSRRQVGATEREPLLPAQASQWPTPAARDEKNGQASDETMARNARPLNEVASRWLTPSANDADKSNDGPATLAKLADGTADDTHHRLRNQVVLWSTPRASERMQENSRDANTSLSRQVQQPTGATSPKRSGRRLNPAFTCWLMGMPWWWTRAEPTSFGAQETESWRCALLRRLSSLCGERE